MNYRKLGGTNITVSEIGFGTWGIGGATGDGATSYGATDDAESLRALRRALELGITFYDTADIYGYGHSEALLGKAFAKERDKVVIASKAGFLKHNAPHDISPKRLRECLEGSLRRLGTDYVDVYFLHSPPLELVEKTPGVIEGLHRMKAERKIRALGFSVKGPEDGFVAIEKYGFDVVEANFNMIDQRALECGLFAAAEKHGAGIIARTPFAFGFLTGAITDLHFGVDDHRSNWPEAQLKLWASTPALFAPVNSGKQRTLSQLALSFCLSFPAVSAVIPGILHPAEAEENAAASSLPPLTPEERAAVIQIYKTHEFFDRASKRA
jgi:aryl-alcohol dehydrogenase-like predicted oxidoreductase